MERKSVWLLLVQKEITRRGDGSERKIEEIRDEWPAKREREEKSKISAKEKRNIKKNNNNKAE